MASRKKTLNFIGNLIGRMAIFHVLFLAAFFACLNPVSIPVLDEFAKGVFDFRGITRKGTMSEKLVTGRCQHCDCHIEFDASGFQEGSMAPVKCPDCQMVTEVFIPQSAPPPLAKIIPPKQTAKTPKTLSEITPVPLKSPINIDDYRHLVMWKGVEVEQVPVKWAFSRRA